MMISCTVPGKAILFGEHAVVYPGNSAVTMPVHGVSCRASVLPDEAASYAVRISDKASGLDIAFSSEELQTYLIVAKKNYKLFDRHADVQYLHMYKDAGNYLKLIASLSVNHLQQHGIAAQPIHLRLQSSIPQGGMGSSAALAASLIKTFMLHNRLTLQTAEWNELTLEAERFQHGRPSGGDVAAVMHGKTILVTRGQTGATTITTLDNTGLPPKFLRHCYVVHTGRPKNSTGEMVAYVRKRHRRSMLIDAIEINTRAFLNSLKTSTLTERLLVDLININGRLLEELGVVTSLGIDINQRVRMAGGGAKVSGAGGLGPGACGALFVYLTDQTLLKDLVRSFTVYPLADTKKEAHVP